MYFALMGDLEIAFRLGARQFKSILVEPEFIPSVTPSSD